MTGGVQCSMIHARRHALDHGKHTAPANDRYGLLHCAIRWFRLGALGMLEDMIRHHALLRLGTVSTRPAFLRVSPLFLKHSVLVTGFPRPVHLGLALSCGANVTVRCRMALRASNAAPKAEHCIECQSSSTFERLKPAFTSSDRKSRVIPMRRFVTVSRDSADPWSQSTFARIVP